MSSRILNAQQPVTALADSVSLHVRLRDMVVQVLQVYAAVLGRVLVQSKRAKPYDADGICGFASGRSDQSRRQKFREEECSDAVHAQRKLVAPVPS